MSGLEDFMEEHIDLRNPWVMEQAHSPRGPT